MARKGICTFIFQSRCDDSFHCSCIIYDFWSLQQRTMAAELERYVQHISKCLALHWIVNQPRLRWRRDRERMQFSKCIVSGCIVLRTAWSQRSIIFFSFSPLMSLDLCTFCVSNFPNTYRLVSRTKNKRNYLTISLAYAENGAPNATVDAIKSW